MSMILGGLTSCIIFMVTWYVTLFPIAVNSSQLWTALFFSLSMGITFKRWLDGRKRDSTDEKKNSADEKKRKIKPGSVALFIVGAVFLIGECISSPLLQPDVHANRITVNAGSFEEDIPKVADLKKIPLMDSDTAAMIGNRAIGELTDVVSQFTPNGYRTIIYQNKVVKVAPLLYNSFWKWSDNRKKGIPGYVVVDPEDGSSDYIQLETPMIYSQSAFFSKNVTRHARISFPDKHFGNLSFQLDDDGTPYWTIMTEVPQTFFSAKKPDGLIIMNAITGDMNWYQNTEIPEWIDLALTGDDTNELYTAYGMYQNGFFNAFLSQKGCTKTTSGYGYIAVGNDICIYTGVTSAASDASNLGFLIVNSRTGEYTYYASAGADEYSAMGAAEGAFQNFGYMASFPALINVSGDPVYAMALKDASGLIKAYAFVNEENYTVVGTGETLNEAMNNYRVTMAKKGYDIQDFSASEDTRTQMETVKEINFITLKNETYTYIRTESGQVYKELFNERHLLFSAGDRFQARFDKTEAGKDVIQAVMDQK